MPSIGALLGVALFAASAAEASPSSVQLAAIYGDDNRKDLYSVTDPRIVRLARSTVAILHSRDDVALDASGREAVLQTDEYGKTLGLCEGEGAAFASQPFMRMCSGFLVAPDVIATAGHCMKDKEQCAGARFVFGFAFAAKDADPRKVPAGQVYGCREIIDGEGQEEDNENGRDWALVRLDRPVLDREPLALDRSGGPSVGTSVFVIGHGHGLPTKVADDARVRSVSAEGFFTSNLDAFTWNSGSPVFSAETGLVEGILVQGETDMVYDAERSCHHLKVCDQEGCRGEDAMNVSAFAPLVPPVTPIDWSSGGADSVVRRELSLRAALNGLAAQTAAELLSLQTHPPAVSARR